MSARRTAVTVILLLVTIPSLCIANPSETETPPLVIRLFDHASVGATVRRSAMLDVARILKSVGLNATWVDCSNGAAESLSCRRPVSNNEVILRLTRSSQTPGPWVPMGDSVLAPGARHASLATVYVDRVSWVARSTGIDMQPLFARAIAHEIGHLLQNTDHHAPTGIMRALWSQAELRRNNSFDWRFSRDEGMRMRASLDR